MRWCAVYVHVHVHLHAYASWLTIASVPVEVGLVWEPVDLGSSPETSVSSEKRVAVPQPGTPSGIAKKQPIFMRHQHHMVRLGSALPPHGSRDLFLFPLLIEVEGSADV